MSEPSVKVAHLNPNQIRHVLARFSHVDELLRSIEQVTRSDLSPFSSERPDLSPDEARLVLAFVAQARRRMLAALDRLAIPRPEPNVSARWSVQTSLGFADLALAELGPAELKGYGDVDPDAAAELEALATDLRSLVGRGVALLHEHEPGQLRERVAGLAGRVGEVLRALEQISRERGLAEVRPLIAATTERATATTFDVGVFGRVSSGKSSLINALIGENLLPIGATPVTAVPLRIGHGGLAATLHLADGRTRAISVAELAEYATEELNPQNRRGVKAIELSAPGVPTGLRFLDTPGIGSLSQSGPAQAFAWLPRCDLGVVLVAAGNPVGIDDLALLTGLTQAGIAGRVLLSKSDLLSAPDLKGSLAYLREELEGALGPGHTVSVQSVSSLPTQRDTLAELHREVLEPLAAQHVAAARDALRLRLHRLITFTAAALAGRRESKGARVVELQRALAAARQAMDRETDRLRVTPGSMLDQAVGAVTSAWASGRDGAPVLRQVLLGTAGDALLVVRSALDGVRRIAGTAGDGRRLPPLFDPDFLDALPPLPPPAGVKRLVAHTVATRRLENLAQAAASALGRYADRLAAWGRAGLDEVATASAEPTPESISLPDDLLRLDELVESELGPA